MKRQIAIVGLTPEFVRWSIRYDCPLRSETNVASVDETEKRLRAIQTAGIAVQEKNVHEDIAFHCDEQGDWFGFRINDVFGPWSGYDPVRLLCTSCPANPSQSSTAKVTGQLPILAGCFGWLTPVGNYANWHRVVDLEWPGDSPSFSIRTNPRWYSLWADRTLGAGRLEHAIELFQKIALSGRAEYRSPAQNFHNVLSTCQRQGLTMDVELVPAGFSNGITWTIGRHCDQCRAAFDDTWKHCRVCQKQGLGHPPIKKRVLGLRPWVPLTQIIGEANLPGFLSRARSEPGA